MPLFLFNETARFVMELKCNFVFGGKDKYHFILNSIEMKRKKRIKKRRRVKKPLVILSVATFIVIILSAALYLGQLQGGSQKKSADEYFEIFDATVNLGEFRDPPIGQGGSYENSSILIIKGVSFKLRAIRGDAHAVIVKSWGKAEPVDLETILKGQWKYVEQESPYGYLSQKAENGKFPFPVDISSREAEGTIIVYL